MHGAIAIVPSLYSDVICNVATKRHPVVSYCRIRGMQRCDAILKQQQQQYSALRYAPAANHVTLIFSQSTASVNATRNVIVAILLHTQIYLSSSFGARGCTRNTFRSRILFSPSAV